MQIIIRKLIVVVSLVVCLKCEVAFGYRSFWKGRHINGNLGQPSKSTIDQSETVTTEWFDQNLDHFDITNNATWKQRFYTNSEYFIDKKTGPIFLFIGGEGTATIKWMKEGAWIHYAQEHKALCFQLEHRFYGESHPTKDLSTENLIHLSSEQALADLANFIVSMNQKFDLNQNSNKWIAFGGSYAGSLAAWLREKYPHLIHGAISSSAPLLAVVDFDQYYKVVAQSLATYSDDCVTAVQKGTKQVELQLKDLTGQQSLSEILKLCDPIEKSIENQLDISNLFDSLASHFAVVVQHNKVSGSNGAITIDQVCDIMVNQTIGPPVNRLAEVNSLFLDYNKQKCLDYKYDKMIASMQKISWNSEIPIGMRQWIYQTCTEFGFYQTSNEPSHIFGNRFPVKFATQQCTDIFGKDFNEELLSKSIRRINMFYGGLHADTTNVLFVQGSIDPWHALGLIKSSNPNMPTIFIEGTAHCANMYEPRENDFPQLKEARVKINQYIKELLITSNHS